MSSTAKVKNFDFFNHAHNQEPTQQTDFFISKNKNSLLQTKQNFKTDAYLK